MAVLSTLGALVVGLKAVVLAAIVFKLGLDHLLRERRTDRSKCNFMVQIGCSADEDT
jgi:hypothetical protein